jgi:hypothetical protein
MKTKESEILNQNQLDELGFELANDFLKNAIESGTKEQKVNQLNIMNSAAVYVLALSLFNRYKNGDVDIDTMAENIKKRISITALQFINADAMGEGGFEKNNF